MLHASRGALAILMARGSAGMWLYSVLCGLLLAEVNLNTLGQLGRDGATITTMAERTLGETGSKAVSASYLFLHCAMLVACESHSGGGPTSLPVHFALQNEPSRPADGEEHSGAVLARLECPETLPVCEELPATRRHCKGGGDHLAGSSSFRPGSVCCICGRAGSHLLRPQAHRHGCSQLVSGCRGGSHLPG